MDLRAVIFVPALVACVVFGFLFAMFAANHYLNVLQSTGSGARKVTWPAEPLVDNFWKVLYLSWLIGLWLGPALFVGRVFATKADLPWMRYALPLSVFWICYPLSQLSSLSGPSIWLPFHHDVFGRIARKPQVLIGFLILTGLTLIVFGVGFHWTFNAEGWVYLLLGSPLLVIAGLIYARLLGRLAFALMYTRSVLARRKKKKPVETQSDEADSPPVEEVLVFVQPSELPPIQTPDEGPLAGYNVKLDDTPKKRVRAESATARKKPEPPPPPARPKDDDDDFIAYGMQESEVDPEARAPAEIVKPSEAEMRLLNRDDAPKPPKQVWTAQLMEFLYQPETLAAIGLLTFLCVLAGSAVRVAREFNPTRGAE